MEGSPARGQKLDALASLLIDLSGASTLEDFKQRVLNSIAGQLHHGQPLLLVKDSESDGLDSWLKSHLERHPELRRKLTQGEMVGVTYPEGGTSQAPTPPWRNVLLLPIIAERELIGELGLVLPVEALQQAEEEVELVRQVSHYASPLLSRILELERLRCKNEENESLKAVLEMQTHLQSNVAHELRTPLATVRGYTRMILDGRAGEVAQTQRDYLNTVYENANRLVNLVNWMSHILQYGPQHLRIESVDLRQAWRDCVASSQPAIREKSITVKEQITKEPLITACDRQKIEYVFNSLLAHAIRATNNGGQISVEFSIGRQREITFKITDSGGGLPPEELNRVFERYYGSRLPAEHTKESGLAGVYDIVGLHGGRLFVNSRTGEGSTFLFTLPAVRQDIEEKTADEQAVNSSRRRR